ncbi:MAG TPA: MFS transporter [Gemmatimonas sp.]|uniref:MFS transporter n=1 Tax=Gemmatimonas sp. TaxID=1962908 RepID=UPI002ED7AFBE
MSSRIPRGVWALGFVSMLMDISSEMIHALLPVYMVTVLGTSAIAVGLIEGMAEAIASVTKVFSGALSDWLGRRKLLAALGYGLAAATKPIFPLASTLGWLVAARFIDRVGKGIRGAPRDALVADITPPEMRGAAFGLRQSLDTIGAFLGPLLAIGLMWFTANAFRTVFWLAVVPAMLSVVVLLVFVREPERTKTQRTARMPLRSAEMKQLGGAYWWVVTIATAFTFARFSEAFLILRAQSLGVPTMMIPAVLVVMSIAYSLSAYPVGVLADHMDRITLLLVGLVLLIVADVVLAYASTITALGVGLVLWGLYMGFTQGLLSTMIADAAPASLRGTAFGVYNLVTGVVLLAASALAGFLWDRHGPEGTFLAGAGFAALTVVALLAVRGRFTPRPAAA